LKKDKDNKKAGQDYAKGISLSLEEKSFHIEIVPAIGVNNSALTNAIKTIQEVAKNTAILLIGIDEKQEKTKLCAVAIVPEVQLKKGLKADEWVRSVATLCGGKGGGKPGTAQATAGDLTNLEQAHESAIKLAHKFLV